MLRLATTTLCAAIMAAASLADELPLDRLSACGDMAALASWLRERVDQGFSGCRAPGNEAEAALIRLNDARAVGGPSTCMAAPVAAVAGFACAVSITSAKNAAISCFRNASVAALDAYKPSYTTVYAPKVAAYLAAAANCSAAKDASRLTSSAFSPVIGAIAKFDVGFGSVLKLAAPAEGMVSHGFARLDPKLTSGAPGAVEYLSMFINSSPADSEAGVTRRRSGAWTVQTDRMTQPLSAYNDALRSRGLDAYVNGAGFAVSADGSTRSDEEKFDLLSSWQDNIAGDLELDGFTEMPLSELARAGLDPAEMQRKIMENAPYGGQTFIEKRSTYKIRALMSETADCAGPDGGLIAMIMSMKPVAAKKSDYGDVALFIVGAGSCGGASGKGVIDDEVDRVANSFADNLGD